MSLYNMLNGVNRIVVFYILPVLGKHPEEFPRFRDAFLGDEEMDGTEGKLIIYTRTGGGNRETYAAENQKIRDMPGFLFDYDDTFDSTFANWVFEIPEKWKNDIDSLLSGNVGALTPEYIDLCANTFPDIADKIRKSFTIAKKD